MESLSLTEASILRQFLTDPTGKVALSAFLEKQRMYYSDRCAEMMLENEVDEAKRMACFALAYETMLPELNHFVENQLRRIA